MLDIAPLVAQARTAGVDHDENLPFLFRPQKPNGRAALLIHGFSASPQELRTLGERLAAQGYLALGARLAGHGTSPEDLRGCRWQDWYASAWQASELLAGAGLPIDLVAQSTGALIGLELALRQPFRRLVLYSPFLRIYNPLGRLAGWIKHLKPYLRRELEPGTEHFYYARRPLAAIEQLNLLAAHLQPQLDQVRQPVLALSAQQDRTVSSPSGRELYVRLGSALKEYHCFGPLAPHDLGTPEHPHFEEVWERTRDFLSTD